MGKWADMLQILDECPFKTTIEFFWVNLVVGTNKHKQINIKRNWDSLVLYDWFLNIEPDLHLWKKVAEFYLLVFC